MRCDFTRTRHVLWLRPTDVPGPRRLDANCHPVFLLFKKPWTLSAGMRVRVATAVDKPASHPCARSRHGRQRCRCGLIIRQRSKGCGDGRRVHLIPVIDLVIDRPSMGVPLMYF